jgi:ferrous iron transport protein A
MRAVDYLTCGVCNGCTTCSMDCLQQGCFARVLSVSGDREFRRRLLEMGFCNGVAVEMVRRAPFGDPIEFRLRGYNLSLRHEQARHVLVSIAG